MQQQNIMNLILYDMSQRRAPEIITTDNIINEIIDGWAQNKYVFPQHPIEFKHHRQKTYRLM